MTITTRRQTHSKPASRVGTIDREAGKSKKNLGLKDKIEAYQWVERNAPVDDPFEKSALSTVVDETVGWSKKDALITYEKFALRARCSVPTMRRALARLEAKGLVEATPDAQGKRYRLGPRAGSWGVTEIRDGVITEIRGDDQRDHPGCSQRSGCNIYIQDDSMNESVKNDIPLRGERRDAPHSLSAPAFDKDSMTEGIAESSSARSSPQRPPGATVDIASLDRIWRKAHEEAGHAKPMPLAPLAPLMNEIAASLPDDVTLEFFTCWLVTNWEACMRSDAFAWMRGKPRSPSFKFASQHPATLVDLLRHGDPAPAEPGNGRTTRRGTSDAWRQLPNAEKIQEALMRGKYAKADRLIEEGRRASRPALRVVNNSENT